MKNQENKIALVTGAGTGVGRGIAKTLAKQGYKVIITGRRQEKLDAVAKEIDNANVIVIAADVSDKKSLQDLRENLLEHTDGKLDLLVNNVGGVPALGKISDITLEDWKKTMDLNLTTQFMVTQTFLPELRKSGKGKIISVTSGMAHFFMEGFGAYSASKAAVEALMKTVAEEEKEHGIEIHLFDPENVISEGNPQGEKDPMEVMDKLVAML